MMEYVEFISNMKYGLVLELFYFSYRYINNKMYTRLNSGGDWQESQTDLYDLYKTAEVSSHCRFIGEHISRRYIK